MATQNCKISVRLGNLDLFYYMVYSFFFFIHVAQMFK